MVLDQKSLKEYPVSIGVPQGSIFGTRLCLLCVNGLPDNIICNVAMLMILFSALKSLSLIRHLTCDSS